MYMYIGYIMIMIDYFEMDFSFNDLEFLMK